MDDDQNTATTGYALKMIGIDYLKRGAASGFKNGYPVVVLTDGERIPFDRITVTRGIFQVRRADPLYGIEDTESFPVSSLVKFTMRLDTVPASQD